MTSFTAMKLFNDKKSVICAFVLFISIIVLFFLGVLNREPFPTNSIKSELFWGYNNPPQYIYRDNIVNLFSFVPIGLLTGIVFKKYRVLTALLIGLLVSLTIECSQLIWKRGTFDVDDLFNNTLGAFIGGLLVWVAISIMEKRRVRV